MSETLQPLRTPVAYGAIPLTWYASVKEALARDLQAIRPGPGNTIEVLSTRGGGWMPLNLFGGVTQFVSEVDRDKALHLLTQEN